MDNMKDAPRPSYPRPPRPGKQGNYEDIKIVKISMLQETLAKYKTARRKAYTKIINYKKKLEPIQCVDYNKKLNKQIKFHQGIVRNYIRKIDILESWIQELKGE